MPNYAIELAYDGTDYCGWQIQRGIGYHANRKPSIEGTLVKVIEDLCGEKVGVIASGRTDSGVHASGQVAHFSLPEGRIDDENLLSGLNHRLPDTIQIHLLGRVPDGFRAPRSSRKQYSYYFQQGPSNLPHLRNYTMWSRYALNGDAMNHALQLIVGEHDFFALCSSGAKVLTTVRTIYEAEVTREVIPKPGCFDPQKQFLWRVRLVGSGFLKQMIRSIAGTLKQIGEERRPPEDLRKMIDCRARELVGPTAPACGLWLDRVWYPPQDGIDFLHQFPSNFRM